LVDGAQQRGKYGGPNIQYSGRGEERASRLFPTRSIGDRMFSAECQAEKRGLATDILLIYEFEPKMMNERFLWNAWKQAENKNKTLLENRNSTIAER
jgi:hypothetical protein